MADPQLVQQMRQTVSLSFSSGTVNDFGEMAVSAPTTMLCRHQAVSREYEKIDGTEVRSMSLLLFNVSSGFTPTFDMQIWLPGTSSGTAGMARRPVNIHGCVDEFGNVDHWEVAC